jgi:hypothetical protein
VSTVGGAVGSFGVKRAIFAVSPEVGDDWAAVVAGEAYAQDGPFHDPARLRRLNAFARATRRLGSGAIELTAIVKGWVTREPTVVEVGIGHQVADVEVLVDRQWRDDLRAELALTWAQIVHALPAEQTVTVLGLGGASPGWYDAPEGGWVDRAGRLVVDDERTSDGEVRLAGPALTVVGAVLLLMGWYTGADAVVVLAGVALTVFGLLLPR